MLWWKKCDYIVNIDEKKVSRVKDIENIGKVNNLEVMLRKRKGIRCGMKVDLY